MANTNFSESGFRRLSQSLGLRLAAVYGGVFASCILLVAGLSLFRVTVLVEQVINTWGQTVAEQLAQSTLDATMQNDAIALQAHMGRLLKAEGIVSASVYDVQNTLLAQAGATPRELHGRAGLHSFPATMALGDNAIGRVVVVIDAEKVEALHHELYWIMVAGGISGGVLLLVVSFYVARQAHNLHRRLSENFIHAMPEEIVPAASLQELPLLSEAQFNATLDSLGDYVAQLQHPSLAFLASAAAELFNPSAACAYILFEVRNLETLQRQVSRERLMVLLNLHEQHIGNACRLYGAQRVPVAGTCIKLVFPANTDGVDAAFQAACCAYVLIGLLQECVDPEMGIRLQWGMALDWHGASNNELLRNAQRSQDEQRSHWLCEQVGSGMLACSAELAERLGKQDKLALVEASGTGGRLFYRLGSVQDTQRAMLDRQIEQLREI